MDAVPRPDPPEPLWTSADVARYALVSPYTVRRAAKSGELQSVRLKGDHGQYRFLKEWVDRWLGLLLWLVLIGVTGSLCGCGLYRLLERLADVFA